jgi:hypothetical protein
VSPARPILGVLLAAGGLAVWAAHFTAIYATHALACERAPAGARLLGLPAVPLLVAAFTLLALAVLGGMIRAARVPLLEPASEGEPGFTRWFAAAAAGLAAVAVLFQAVPALVLPACG